jgi:hypothetical protein
MSQLVSLYTFDGNEITKGWDRNLADSLSQTLGFKLPENIFGLDRRFGNNEKQYKLIQPNLDQKVAVYYSCDDHYPKFTLLLGSASIFHSKVEDEQGLMCVVVGTPSTVFQIGSSYRYIRITQLGTVEVGSQLTAPTRKRGYENRLW